MKKKLLIGLVVLLIGPGAAQQPDNITVSLDFSPSNAFIDGQSYENTKIINAPSFGYVSSSQPVGVVSYNEDPLRAGFIDSEEYYITQKSSEFLVPFTEGGPSAIEDREGLIQNGKLMDKLNPSFSFGLGSERIIRVSYHFTYTVAEIVGPETGIDEVLVRNRIHTGNQTELVLKTS